MIFDVDGTLVDSVDLHAKAWQDAFAEFGYQLAFAAVRGQIGKGGDQLMPVFLEPDELKRVGETLQARRGEIFKHRYMQQIKPFPQVRALLERLLDDGIRIALASSAKADELQVYKDLANIGDLLDAETTSDDADKSKPHPDIFNAAVERLDGLGVNEIRVVGDTPYDAQAASKAGLATIGLLCGGWPDQELRDAGCAAIYQDPAALMAAYVGSASSDWANN